MSYSGCECRARSPARAAAPSMAKRPATVFPVIQNLEIGAVFGQFMKFLRLE
jgi:hypothetical protein